MQLTLEDRIRERAYYISQASGGAGDDRQFWLMAEREVLAEIATESAAQVEADPVAHVAAEPVSETFAAPEVVAESAPEIVAEVTPVVVARSAPEVVTEVAPAPVAQIAKTEETAKPTAAKAAPKKPKKAASKSRAKSAKKKPAKAATAATPTPAAPPLTTESPTLQPSVLTPITSSVKTTVKPAAPAATKARARCGTIIKPAFRRSRCAVRPCSLQVSIKESESARLWTGFALWLFVSRPRRGPARRSQQLDSAEFSDMLSDGGRVGGSARWQPRTDRISRFSSWAVE